MTILELAASKGLKYVHPRGNPTSQVWLVGEAPGEREEAEGFAFVGPSGKELGRMLGEAGFEPTKLYYTNPYPIRPPNNDLTKLESLGIPQKIYEEDFIETLRKYQPPLIIPLGETAAKLLCPDTAGGWRSNSDGYIHKWMGSLLRSPYLAWPHYVIPNLHPAYILRAWGERIVSVLVLSKVREEFAYLMATNSLRELPVRNIKFRLSSEQVVEELNAVNSQVAFDIETLRRRFPYTISLATCPTEAISFKLWGHGVFGGAILRQLDRIFTSLPLIGQNSLSFDANWLNTLGFNINIQNMDDIMVMHHVRWPELKHALSFTNMQYTREPFYKDDGRSWSAKDDLSRLLLYNGKDSCVTYEIYLALKEEMNA